MMDSISSRESGISTEEAMEVNDVVEELTPTVDTESEEDYKTELEGSQYRSPQQHSGNKGEE